MNAVAAAEKEAGSWSFPSAFWTANLIELCERAAYYGWFIMLRPFLTDVVHFTDIEVGYVAGPFAALLYLMPFLSGAFADRVGYRRALLLALFLLGCGYTGLGLFPARYPVLLSMMLIMLGGALVKPIITGTVARTSDAQSRARAFSIFYAMVNIGAFLGKTIAKPVRVSAGLGAMPLCSATVALIGLILVALFYFPKDHVSPGEPEKGTAAPSLGEAFRKLISDLGEVFHSGRLMALVLITSGFWIIQSQMYSSMPQYVLRMIGPGASPEWYANINPVVVMLCVVPVTYLSRKLPAMASIALSMMLIPLSALAVAVLPHTLGRVGPFPAVTVAFAIGIAMQGFAECFLSPRYLEIASRQAPAGKEALYMGYAHLNNFFAWLFGYILSGYLLNAFCPNPSTLSPADQLAYQQALATGGPMPAAYAHAHYLWYVFAVIGGVAFVLFLAFMRASASGSAAEGAASRSATKSDQSDRAVAPA